MVSVTYKISLYHFETRVLFKVLTVAVLMFSSHVLQNYLCHMEASLEAKFF
jgi:hypothetical protein